MNLFFTFFVILMSSGDYSVFSAVTMRRRPVLREEILARTASSTTTSTTTIIPETTSIQQRLSRLSLPSNATSIRSDISDNFSCTGKIYGYYADVDNDCQIFHVCLPVTYADGKEQLFRWSFICPEETTFNQEAFTCVRTDEMSFNCDESENFYELNRNLGLKETAEDIDDNALELALTSDESRPQNEEFKTKLSDNRRKLVTTLGPKLVATTTTTPLFKLNTRTESIRVPVTRRTPTRIVRRTTLPSTAVPSTTSNQPITTVPVQYTTNAEIVAAITNIPIKSQKVVTEPHFDQTERYEKFTADNMKYDEFFTTTDAHSATSTVIPFSEYVTMVSDANNNRIVPDLLEIGNNEQIETQNTPALDSEQTKVTDEVVDNIKQLQNILPKIYQQASESTNAKKQFDDQRRKRFLFKADTIKNRRRIFNNLNDKH